MSCLSNTNLKSNNHFTCDADIKHVDLKVPKLFRNGSDTSVSTLIKTNDINSLSEYQDSHQGDDGQDAKDIVFNMKRSLSAHNIKNNKNFDFVPHDEIKMLQLQNDKSHKHNEEVQNYHPESVQTISNTSSTDLQKDAHNNNNNSDSKNNSMKFNINIVNDPHSKTSSTKSTGGILHSILKKTLTSPIESSPERRASVSSDQKSINSSLTINSSLSSNSKAVRFASNNDLVRVRTFNNTDEPSCLNNKPFVDVNKSNSSSSSSKEFIGMNVKYCLREWYLDEKSKERNERIEKLKNRNSDINKKKKIKKSEKLNSNSFFKNNSILFDNKSSDSKDQEKDSDEETDDYDDDDDDSSSDYSDSYYEDDGLNFKKNSKLSSLMNFSSNPNWGSTPSSSSFNKFPLKSKKQSFSSFLNSPTNKRMSLTNLSSTNYYFEKMKEPKPRSTSLDDLKHFGLPTSPNIKKDQTFTILESNFDYKKNIISQYPWQYKSKTIEMKSISLEPTLNEVIIFLSVQNLAFEKLLEVKYSFDNWNSISFTEGIFCKQINNNFDEFKCIIKMPSSNEKNFKTNLDFCCKYEVKGLTYYDNNDYNNFRIKIQTTQKSTKFDASVKLPEVKMTPSNSNSSTSPLSSAPNTVTQASPDLSMQHTENTTKQQKDLLEDIVIKTETKQNPQMTRKFDSSKEFYNKSPWKNVYKQESFTNIFNTDSLAAKNENNNKKNFIIEDDRLTPSLDMPGYDPSYVIQNNSETSDSILTSDEEDTKNGFASYQDDLDLVVTPQKRRYSFSSFDSQSGTYLKRSSMSHDDIAKKSSNKSNGSSLSSYKIKNPLLAKFQKELKVDSDKDLYSELIKNYCFFEPKNAKQKVNEEKTKNLSNNPVDIDEKLSDSTSNATIKDVKKSDPSALYVSPLAHNSSYSYQILSSSSSSLQNNDSANPNNFTSSSADRASPRSFSNSRESSDVSTQMLTNNNFNSDNTINVLK